MIAPCTILADMPDTKTPDTPDAGRDLEMSVLRGLIRRRLYIVQGVLGMGIGIVLFMVSEAISRLFRIPFVSIQIASGLFFLAGLGILLMSYLQGDRLGIGSGGIRGFEPVDPSVERLTRELRRLKSDLAAIQADKGAGTHLEDLNKLRQSVAAEITSDVERRLSAEAMAKSQLDEIRAAFANAYTRLDQALEQISRRGNLNLIIGGITTAIGAASLGYMAFTAPASTDLKVALSHYIPRLSTVIFLEVFAFFFLRLYKSTLVDSKFYQVELTWLATVDIALQAAVRNNDPTVISSVLTQIVSARRPSVAPEEKSIEGEVDVKGFASVLEKFGKLVMDASKAKT